MPSKAVATQSNLRVMLTSGRDQWYTAAVRPAPSASARKSATQAAARSARVSFPSSSSGSNATTGS
jgi:hypothetical protein